MTKKVLGVILALLLNSCIPKQTHTWKTESVVETKYKKVDEVTEREDRYSIDAYAWLTGEVTINVKKGKFDVNYEIIQPVNIELQREYRFGFNRFAGYTSLAGWAAFGLGFTLPQTCEYYMYDEHGNTTHCSLYKDSDMESGMISIGGLVGVCGAIWFLNEWRSEHKTRNYRQTEIPVDTLRRKPSNETQLITLPAINTPIEITSQYFTVNGSYQADIQTNVHGNATVQLEPTNPNFAFTLDDLANTDTAQQLRDANYRDWQFMPVLQQSAVPISYDVTITTKATGGENASTTVHVKGYDIPQKALEQVIIGL